MLAKGPVLGEGEEEVGEEEDPSHNLLRGYRGRKLLRPVRKGHQGERL